MLPQDQIYVFFLAMLVIVWTDHVVRNELSENRIRNYLGNNDNNNNNNNNNNSNDNDKIFIYLMLVT